MLQMLKTVTGMPLIPHVALAAGAFAGLQWVQTKLDNSYAASGHPVDYFTGQTRFSGSQVKEYYATMIEGGTLETYWTTQIIDFGFILAVICIGAFFCTLLARAGRAQSWARHLGLLSGVAAIGGALSDAAENLVSFVMLASPVDFPDWLAIVYSSFAAFKFALITCAMLLLALSLLAAVVGRLTGKPILG